MTRINRVGRRTLICMALITVVALAFGFAQWLGK